MSEIPDDVRKALEAAARMPKAPLFDSVENHDGVAVFKRGGRTVGLMNWADYEAACQEIKNRKGDANGTD